MKPQQGITLYLSLIIMGILFSLALGINTILLGQTKIVQDISDSVFAFAAAETGIERNLYDGSQGAGSLENGATYFVTVFASGVGGCPAGINYCVKSVGTYKTTNRAIYISR